MNEHAQSVLTSYGPLGVFAFVSLLAGGWFLRWIATVITPRIMGHFDKSEAVMESTVKAINDMGQAVRDLVAETSRAREEAEERTIDAVAKLTAEIERNGNGKPRRRRRRGT